MRKRNNAKYYGHYIYASSQGQRTHSARTNWGEGGPNVSPLESNYFHYLRAHTKLQNPMKCPCGLDLKFGHFPVKIGLIGRVGGFPIPFFPLQSYYFCYLGAHTKLQNPMMCPSVLVLKFAHFPVKIGLMKIPEKSVLQITGHLYFWNQDNKCQMLHLGVF